MKSIPSGNVTFLFTDIEGSTKLAQQFPDALHSALFRHHEILQHSIETNKGYVFQNIGDAFCGSFDNSCDAIEAAYNAQKMLMNEPWKEIQIKVRMGIHTGEAEWNGKSYIGYLTLSRTERVMSAGHGGQILFTQDTCNVIRNKLPDEFSILELGEQQLKDLIRTEHIFQLVAPNLILDFPPLKTLSIRKDNLPVQMTNFIGRENEIKKAKELLSKTKLLSLVGTGGTGKTRLSLQVAAEMINDFKDGVWFIELASLSEPLYIIDEIAIIFNLPEDGKRKTIDIILDYLKEKEALLILDNCEHLIKECAKISDTLLRHCPKLKILSTSRESFHITGEKVYHVPSLSLPDRKENLSAESLFQYESIRLFSERASSVKHDFVLNDSNANSVAELCRKLDGIPLAIELASARIKNLPVEKILVKLKDRFDLLTRGSRSSLPRQQTLRALIDWSYDLLSHNEKIFLQRLSVFAGGWTLEAAEEVCADDKITESEILDLLANLVEKSLVKVNEMENSFRYNMLETIRHYGDEKLIESKEKSKILKKHFDFFLKLTEESEIKLKGIAAKQWIEKLDIEIDNIRESLKWSSENEVESALRMAVALGEFWDVRGYFVEGFEFLSNNLEKANNVEKNLKAKILFWEGFFLHYHGKYVESKKLLHQSLDLFRETKDNIGIANSLNNLGSNELYERDYEKAKKFYDESLSIFREMENKHGIARCLNNLGIIPLREKDYESSRKFFEESLVISREINNITHITSSLGNLGLIEYLTGNFERAKKIMEECLALDYELGNKSRIARSLQLMGIIAFAEKDYAEAQKFQEESLPLAKELGDKRLILVSLQSLGEIAAVKKNFPIAQKIFRECVTISNELGDKNAILQCLEGLANCFLELGKIERACRLFASIKSLNESLGILSQVDCKRYEQTIFTLKSKLDTTKFEEESSNGKTLTLEEAVEFALSSG